MVAKTLVKFIAVNKYENPLNPTIKSGLHSIDKLLILLRVLITVI